MVEEKVKSLIAQQLNIPVEKVVDNAGDVCNTSDHVYFTSVAGSQLAKEIWDGLEDVKEYEKELYTHMELHHSELLCRIREGFWDQRDIEELDSAVKNFTHGFAHTK